MCAGEILALRSSSCRWPVTSQSTCGLEEAGKGWGGIAGLSRAVRRSGLSEKMPFEERCEGCERDGVSGVLTGVGREIGTSSLAG